MKRVVVGLTVGSCLMPASAYMVDDDEVMFAAVAKAPQVIAETKPVKHPPMIDETRAPTVFKAAPVVAKVEEKKPEPRGPISATAERALELLKHAKEAGIRGLELSQFMAQAAHESAGFRRLTEVGDRGYFRKYDPKHNPRLAERLGNLYAGDGERFKGRGFLQLTGRDNYRKAGEALGLPLEQYPDMVSRPDIAAKTSIWYWKTRVRPDVDNWRDTHAVTREINGGLNGIHDRVSMFQKFRNIFAK